MAISARPSSALEAGRETAQRPFALGGIVDDLEACRHVGQFLARCAHQDDRAVADRAGEDPGQARSEWLAVPVEAGLRVAHPRRAAADEQDRADRQDQVPEGRAAW